MHPALILLVGIIWVSLWGLLEFRKSKLEADEAYQNYKSNTYTEQHKTAEQIASECGVTGAPVDFVRECLAERIEAYADQDTTDQDQKAQQDMAFWAKICMRRESGHMT